MFRRVLADKVARMRRAWLAAVATGAAALLSACAGGGVSGSNLGPGSPPPRIWPPGPDSVRGTTNPPVSTSPAGPVKATSRSAPSSPSAPGRPGRTGTYVGARFRRMHRRFGKTGGGKAAIAIAHTLIVVIWHVLHDGAEYRDLGSDYFARYDNPEAHKRRLIRDLQTLGYNVTVRPAA